MATLRRRTRGRRYGRVGAGVDVFAVDILGAGVEGGAVLSAGVLLLEAVELEFCGGGSVSWFGKLRSLFAELSVLWENRCELKEVRV